MSSPNHSTAERSRSAGSGAQPDQSSSKRERPEDAQVKKSARACLNCRKQKMKCDIDRDPPCRRCAKSNTPCLFKVRANGIEAGDWYISDQNINVDENFKQDILNRLQTIETKLGITRSRSRRITSPGPDILEILPPAPVEAERALPDLWTALGVLIGSCSETDKIHRAWNTMSVEALWLSFAEHMPALHFSTQRIFNDRPTPLLLASVLFAASIQHPLGEYAQLSPFYHSAAANAIAQLAVPTADSLVLSDAQDLQDALGIIILGLLSEAWVDQTGIWISMAYQLILNGACKCDRAKLHEWKSLYEGLRVVDIEHASLRMTYPVLPLLCPISTLESIATEADSPRQAWTHLTTIMHVGLSHFAGRGTSTIMDTVLKDTAPRQTNIAVSPDLRSIKGWANELDAWLLKYHKPSKSQQRGPSEANVILLQYQLHKLFVIFIHHSVTPGTSTEDLLAAARGALRIQRLGMAVWSNWDLVLITFAALIVINHCKLLEQQEDRMLVQGHINALRATSQSQPNLRSTLAARLEGRLQSALTTATVDPQAMNFGDLHHSPPVSTSQPYFTDTLFGLSDLETWWTNEMNNGQDVTATDPVGTQFDLGLGTWPPAFQRIMGGLLDPNDSSR